MANEIVRFNSFDEVRQIAETFALTGYFDAKGTNPVEVAKAATKIMAGAEMGFRPFASINGINIIQGRPSVPGNLIATAIKRSGKYDYRVREKTSTSCRVEFFERIAGKMESIGTEVFTAEDARKAGTKNMATYPKNMLFNRAISNGYRTFCPDVFEAGSVYTPEELGADVDGEGEIIESTARIVNTQTGEITEAAAQNGNSKAAPVQVDQPPPTITPATLKRLNILGSDFYGKTWDTERPRLVGIVTNGEETSSKNLREDEAQTLITGIQKRIAKRDAEAAELAARQPEPPLQPVQTEAALPF